MTDRNYAHQDAHAGSAAGNTGNADSERTMSELTSIPGFFSDDGDDRRNAAGVAAGHDGSSFDDGNDDTPGDLMTIREMSDAFEVTPRTLRFYEAKELLFPIRKGQKRLFTRRDRARLKLILRGKRFGFRLEEIRQLLELYHMGDQQLTQLSRTHRIGLERLADMERQRDDLNRTIADLKEQLAWGERMIATLSARQTDDSDARDPDVS